MVDILELVLEVDDYRLGLSFSDEEIIRGECDEDYVVDVVILEEEEENWLVDVLIFIVEVDILVFIFNYYCGIVGVL